MILKEINISLLIYKDNTQGKMPADNKRFGEIGGGVIIRTSVYRFSVSDSPNGVGLNPQLRQAAGTLSASERTRSVDMPLY